MTSLSEYLRARGLSLDPQIVDEDSVLNDDLVIKEVADLWQGHQGAIVMVLQARINALGKVILEKAPPEEVLVLRQCMVEIGAIIDDFRKYHSESERRVKKNPIEAITEEVPTQPPKEGEEGTL